MPNLPALILLCLLAVVTPVRAAEKPDPEPAEELTAEDLKIVAVMEILQLMDMVEEIDMVKDFNYLIEDDQNDSQND